MRALSVYFDYGSDDYSRLLNVFRNSWDQNATFPLEVIKLDVREGTRRWPYHANTEKLKAWVSNFDQDTLFIDCDMLCLKCPKEGFDVENIGIAKRSHTAPFNGGVIFAKYTDYTKGFLTELVEVNDRMYKDKDFHQTWKDKYAGINQSAMGYLFENGYDYTEIPESYNLCQPWSDWENAHLVHIKQNQLRNVCLGGIDTKEQRLLDIKERWESYAEPS